MGRLYLLQYSSVNYLRHDTTPLEPQANSQSQVFKVLWKVKRVEIELEGKMFQKSGVTAEKSHLLDPASQNSMVNGARRMSPLPARVEWANPIKRRWFLMYFR